MSRPIHMETKLYERSAVFTFDSLRKHGERLVAAMISKKHDFYSFTIVDKAEFIASHVFCCFVRCSILL